MTCERTTPETVPMPDRAPVVPPQVRYDWTWTGWHLGPQSHLLRFGGTWSHRDGRVGSGPETPPWDGVRTAVRCGGLSELIAEVSFPRENRWQHQDGSGAAPWKIWKTHFSEGQTGAILRSPCFGGENQHLYMIPIGHPKSDLLPPWKESFRRISC